MTPQRQEGQPGPLQQRLDQAPGAGDPGVRGQQREPRQRGHRPGDRIRGQHHVGVQEHQHLGVPGGVGELRAGVRLAEPAVRQRAAGEQPHLVTGDRPHHVGGAVGRTVVQHQDLQVPDAALAEQRIEARRDPVGLVAQRQQHGHPRAGGGTPGQAAQQDGIHHGVPGEQDQRHQREPAHAAIRSRCRASRTARGITTAPMTTPPHAAEAGRSRKTA
jgi:hypothetical protein